MTELASVQTAHYRRHGFLVVPDRLAFAVRYVSEGTWVYRCDVQDTVSADEYSKPLR